MSRLLIISNNVLSRNTNNGKTIFSLFEGSEDIEISQLYLSGESPKIPGYNYYQISDIDIIKGLFCKEKRGRTLNSTNCMELANTTDDFRIRNRIGRNDYTLLARDLLWFNKWKSKKLINWLDSFMPESILFVAGDSIAAYSICEYIVCRYKSKLSVYITDDYIMPRKDEGYIHLLRRKKIIACIDTILKHASSFFTISELMRQRYLKEFGMESTLLFNIVDDYYDDSYEKKEPEIVLTYAGSFYYGRSDVLGKLADAIQVYNKQKDVVPAKLIMYSNTEPTDDIKSKIIISGASEYGGSLSQEQLKERLNTSDVLVFVESFDPQQIEKVKYSFSTKVPEYMSVGKPILALGPDGIGSMDYLRDVALCVNTEDDIQPKLFEILSNDFLRKNLSKEARKKFLSNHDSVALRTQFLNILLGKGK